MPANEHGMSDAGWTWDASLYSGAAPYYPRGRVRYSADLVDLLVDGLRLDGSGHLLDVGCGPGSLTVLLAPHVDQAIGVDADAEMLAEGRRQAEALGITNVSWRHERAEDLTVELGRFHVVTLAQSFHWMDRPRVARLLYDLLTDDGILAHVHATTHEGVPGGTPLPHPRPPRAAINRLIEDHLGPGLRAGQSSRPTPTGETERGLLEAQVYGAAGFTGPTRAESAGELVVRDADDVVASIFSLSSAAPHLFGDRRADFESALRELLQATAPDGLFSEQLRESAVDFWRR